MDTLFFPMGVLEPEQNREFSRRAHALNAPHRTDLGPMGQDEWLARLFFFGDAEGDDLVVSVSGYGAVAATELRWGGGDPGRATLRLQPAEATVLHDRLMRLMLSAPEELAAIESPHLVLDAMEGGKHLCLAIGHPAPHSEEDSLTRAFLDLWPRHTASCRRHLAT